ncbi:unnamed protein product, partial [marine sediment metagenome]
MGGIPNIFVQAIHSINGHIETISRLVVYLKVIIFSPFDPQSFYSAKFAYSVINMN